MPYHMVRLDKLRRKMAEYTYTVEVQRDFLERQSKAKPVRYPLGWA